MKDKIRFKIVDYMSENYFFKITGIIIGIIFSLNVAYSIEIQATKNPIKIKLSDEDSLKAINKLKSDIDNVLSVGLLKRTNYGVAVYSISNKKYYYSKNKDKLLTPASTTKLFTTFNALNTMGPDYRIETGVFTDGTIKDSILNGNLFLVGKGDALMTITDIEYLADAIYEKGIRKINGNIYADGTFYDTMTQRVSYSGDKDIVEPLQPITALCLNKNTATVLVHSGSTPGKLLSAQVIPSSDAFVIQNNAFVAGSKKVTKTQNVKTINQNSKKKVIKNNVQKKKQAKPKKKSKNSSYNYQFSEQRWGDVPPAPSAVSRRKPRITFGTKLDSSGIQKFIINGTLPAGKSYSYKFYIQNPNLVVAGSLKDRLESGGIKINGKTGINTIQTVKNKITQIAVMNRPLMDLVYLTNKNSDNYLAETIFKMTGAYAGNHSNNGKSSQEKLQEALRKYNVPCSKCSLNDGSGLSRRNVVTVDGILHLFIESQKLNFGDELDSSLSIAGIDGTLVNRMKNTSAENNLRGKTGTLRNTSALSGFVQTQDCELLSFSFVFNGPSVGSYKQIENKLGEILANFKYSSVLVNEKIVKEKVIPKRKKQK